MISVAVATPGRTGTPGAVARGDDRGAEAGRHDEPGAGVDGLVDLLRAEHRAGADEQRRGRSASARMASSAAGVRKRHLGDGQPAASERAAERLGPARRRR